MKVAKLTLSRDDGNTSSIITKQYVEMIPFWKITWAPHHVVFHTNEADENSLVAYHVSKVHEIETEEYEDGKVR